MFIHITVIDTYTFMYINMEIPVLIGIQFAQSSFELRSSAEQSSLNVPMSQSVSMFERIPFQIWLRNDWKLSDFWWFPLISYEYDLNVMVLYQIRV